MNTNDVISGKKAGIQSFRVRVWIPAFAGMTRVGWSGVNVWDFDLADGWCAKRIGLFR
jgi:hypothetical protein